MTIDEQLHTAVAALEDEPVTAGTVRAAADEIGRLMRYLGQATQPGTAATALPGPGDAARLVGALHDLTQSLHRTLDQTGDRLATTAPDGEDAERAVRFLRAARDALAGAARELSRAHGSAVQLPG